MTRRGSQARGPASFLFVTQYYPPERGAAQVRIGAIVRTLARRGHRVAVVTAIPNYPTGRLFPGWSRRPLQVSHEEGVEVTRVWLWAAMGSGLGRMVNYASFGFMSLLGLARVRPAEWTVVEYPTLPGALPAVLLARLRGRRIVVHVADLWVDASVAVGALRPGRLVDLMLLVERWMLRQATAVNAVTEGLGEALVAKGVDPARICWLPNGADTDLFSPGDGDPAVRRALGLSEGEHLVLYAGTQGYVHGLEVVLDAAEKLATEPIRFVLVGGGSERAGLEADVTRRNLVNVTFHDPVAPEDVAAWLRCATVGLASVRAGDLYRSVRSAKMLPVMACGRPVVYAGDDEGAALVERVGAGIRVPPGDGTALSAAIAGLVADPVAAAAMGARGRAYVEDSASWSSILTRWLEEIERVPAGPGRR